MSYEKRIIQKKYKHILKKPFLISAFWMKFILFKKKLCTVLSLFCERHVKRSISRNFMGHLTLYLRDTFARSKIEKEPRGHSVDASGCVLPLKSFNGLNGLTTMAIVSLASLRVSYQSWPEGSNNTTIAQWGIFPLSFVTKMQWKKIITLLIIIMRYVFY